MSNLKPATAYLQWQGNYEWITKAAQATKAAFTVGRDYERERIVRELRDHLGHCRIDEPTNYDIYWAKGFAAALDIVKGETP